MCDFQPGDVVVVVGMTKDQIIPRQPPESVDASRGRNYVVTDVAAYDLGLTGILLADFPAPKKSRHWDSRAFRRIYRPDGKFIAKLLEPVDLGTEVG